MGQIKKARDEKNYTGALYALAELISSLPESMKKQFQDRADHIIYVIDLIKANRLQVLQDTPDFYIRRIKRDKILQMYCAERLATFMNDFSLHLDRLGYMENLKMIMEGQADEGMEWIAIDKKRKKLAARRERRRERKDKGKKRVKQTPTGSMD